MQSQSLFNKQRIKYIRKANFQMCFVFHSVKGQQSVPWVVKASFVCTVHKTDSLSACEQEQERGMGLH